EDGPSERAGADQLFSDPLGLVIARAGGGPGAHGAHVDEACGAGGAGRVEHCPGEFDMNALEGLVAGLTDDADEVDDGPGAFHVRHEIIVGPWVRLAGSHTGSEGLAASVAASRTQQETDLVTPALEFGTDGASGEAGAAGEEDVHGASLAGFGAVKGLKTTRSEEHTSELQSREKLVCRL